MQTKEKIKQIEIGGKVRIGEDIYTIVEIDEKEVRLGLNGKILVFKKS